MNEPNSDDIQANSGGNPDLPETTSRNAKPSDPEGPYVFKHKPKVEGDPWEIILKPELEADTARCNVWKEEVQNLLIFAGLFSAVVTAFVIESYQFLQPDPNDAIVGLLFHIANSVNNSAPFPPSVDLASINAPFSQTPSSVRINVFWFCSLILSLTTVLVGTIALQWLREHQFYPNHFSGQEKVAILHMRLQALNAWYVPHIFAGLPLLLQGALVLFLAGMIDFALPLGARLAVPVAVIVGVTLLFLGTMTVLPTFQSLSLFVCGIIYPRTSVPTPCAYKSPQSQACRVLVSLFIRGFFHLFPRFAYKNAKQRLGHDENPLPNALRHLAPSIYLLWDSHNWKSWPTFDREWVSLRDACHHRICDKDPDLYKHRQWWNREFPLSDVTQALLKAVKETPSAKHTKKYLEAAILCFEQLSKSVWMKQQKHFWNFNNNQKDRRNNYFEQLLSLPHCSLSKWLNYGGVYRYGQTNYSALNDIGNTRIVLFHQDQMVYFLRLLQDKHSSSNLAQYQIELWTQVMMQSHIPRQALSAHIFSYSTPTILQGESWNSPIQSIENKYQRYSAVVDVINAVFHSAALHHISEDQSLHALCVHSEMAFIFYKSIDWTDDYLRCADLGQQQRQEIDAQYTSIFKFVAEHLKEEMSNSASHPQEDTPSVLFYLASIFMWELLDLEPAQTALKDSSSRFSLGLQSLLEALLRYRTWTSGRKNDVLENQLQEVDCSYWKHNYLLRFWDEWWDVLVEAGRKIGLEAAISGPALIRGNSLDSRPSSLSQETDPHRSTADIVAIPSFSSAPAGANPEALDVSTSDGNSIDPTSTVRVEPHAMPLVNPGPIHDDRDVGERQQMLGDGDSPVIDNDNTAMVALPGRNDSPNRSASHMPIGEPNETLEPEGNYAATEYTPPDPLLTQPSLASVAAPALPHDIVNIFSDADDAHLQTGEHVAIEVGSAVEVEGSTVIENAASDGVHPQASELPTAIEVGQPGRIEEREHGESVGSGGAPRGRRRRR